MELNLWAVVAIAVGIVPGIPGEVLYRLIAGGSWREDAWSRVFRIVGFSLIGLVLAVLSFRLAGIAVVPEVATAVADQSVSESLVLGLAGLLLGQSVMSALSGTVSGFVVRWLCHAFSMTPYADAWDEYVRRVVPGHWVVVRLLDGSTLAGMLCRADVTVPPENRDIILSEPATYDEGLGNYLSLPLQHLFIPGASLASVAVVYDPQKDQRVSSVGGYLFIEEADYEQGEGKSAETASPSRAAEGDSTRSETPTSVKTAGRKAAPTPAGR